MQTTFPSPPVNYSHFRDFFRKATHHYVQHLWQEERERFTRSRGRKDRRRKRYQPAFNEATLGHCSTPWVEINAALARSDSQVYIIRCLNMRLHTCATPRRILAFFAVENNGPLSWCDFTFRRVSPLS